MLCVVFLLDSRGGLPLSVCLLLLVPPLVVVYSFDLCGPPLSLARLLSKVSYPRRCPRCTRIR